MDTAPSVGSPRFATSGAEQKAFTAEKNTALLRLAVILFGVTVYWTAFYPRGIPWLAGLVTVVALVYALYDVLAEPFRHFPILVTSMWTAITDGVLITVWLHATGDIDSPFYLLWFVSLVAVAFRYDWRATALATFLYIASYTGLVALTGGLPAHAFDVVIRCGYLALLGGLGSLLARESARLFEDRFQLGQRVEEGERFRALAEATPEAIIVARKGIILECNRAFCDLVGQGRDKLLGTPAMTFLAPDSRADLEVRAAHPADAPFEAWIQPSGGPLRLVRVQARTMNWEGDTARVVAIRDITDERAAEETRARALQTEMEVQRLREMDRFKGEFINAAAHELNTPLTPLKLQLHVLKSRLAGAGMPEHQSVELIERNINRLSVLVEDMLDVARLESGRIRLDPKPSDIGRLVEETADTFRELAKQRGIALSTRVTPALIAVADDKRVTQILYNLVSNALKFTAEGGAVDLDAGADGSFVRVDVRDDGVGLTAEQVDRLFHPFVQLHRDQVTFAGTGLGLYISRGMAQRQGGSLTCASAGPGKGATFTLRLPVAVDFQAS